MKACNQRLLALGASLVAGGMLTSAEAAIAEHVTHARASQVELLTYRMDVKDVVSVAGELPAGDWFAARDGGNPALATLTGMLLDKGTTKEDKFAIAKRLDGVGAQLGFGAGTQTVSVQGRALKRDVPLLIEILAEELREPAFSAGEFDKAKKQLQASLKRSLEDTSFRASERLLMSIFPAGHPNHPVALKDWLSAVDSATLDDVKAFYRKYYGPAHLTLVFVGDVDPRAIQAQVAKAFSGWSGGVDEVRTTSGGEIRVLREQKVNVPGKTSVSVVIGEPTDMRYQDSDALALRVATAVLGSGFTGRLMSTVRDREGLTYGIGAGISDDEYVDGAFVLSATFAPTLLEKGMASTRRELARWLSSGITADELAARKTNLVGSYEVSLATTAGMAGAILTTLERGKPLSWLDEYPKAIDALTVEQVNATVARHLNADRLVTVEAGTLDQK